VSGRVCRICGKYRQDTDYYKANGGRTKRTECKHCHSKYYREKYKNADNEYKRKRQESSRKYILSQYDLTQEDYDFMLSKQKCLCAICEGDNNGKNLVVDHDHCTDEVRGLLCHGCNSGLGLLGDDIKSLESALTYLRRHYE